MEFVSSNLNFDFLGKRKICITISLLLIIASIYVWVNLGEKKYGIDYTGGHEFVVQLKDGGDSEAIRSALEGVGIESPIVQSFEAASAQYSIRLGGAEGADSKVAEEQVLSALKAKFNDKFEILDRSYIGPTVGKELRQKAIIATTLGLIGILLYIAFRFEFSFALGAVVAVFHDVIISTGAYLAAGYAINASTVAAVLTILGYSVNDTIVVFDRIREDLNKERNMGLVELMNKSLNTTLSRTIITNFLTFLSALALLLFGGASLSDLSFFLVVGIVVGSYSTIYIASPVVLAWENFRANAERRRTAAKPKRSANA